MKRLRLHRDTLSELAAEDLTAVVAGGDTTSTCNTGLTVCGPCDIQVGPLPTQHRAGC